MTLAHNAEETCLKNQSAVGPAPTEPVQINIVTAKCHNSPDHDPEKAAGPLRYGAVGDPAAAADTSTSSSNAADLEFPEGGLQAWLVVFGSFCAMLSVFGLINTAAVFESYFSQNQLRDYSSSEIGWIFSLYLFIVFFVGIQVGPVFDKYGPKLMVATGGLLIGSSLLILSVCEGESSTPMVQCKSLSLVKGSIRSSSRTR